MLFLVVGGVFGLFELIYLFKLLYCFLSLVLGVVESVYFVVGVNVMELFLILIFIVMVFGGIFLGWFFYIKWLDFFVLVFVCFSGFYWLIVYKFYVDEIYYGFFV